MADNMPFFRGIVKADHWICEAFPVGDPLRGEIRRN